MDKPTGVTSHQVVSWFRRQTGIRKVGHAGTLDPLATGLLIILVSREFTKRQSEFLKQDKEYLCTAEFGYTTDSYDSDGQVITTAPADKVTVISVSDIEHNLQKFTGEIQQTVPAYSAVKRNGKKLYELARAGKLDTQTLPSRTVKIDHFSVEWFECQSVPQAQFRVRCSSGTYIRSLIHDLGQTLAVGATVTQLRRTAIGEHRIADAQFCPLFLPKQHGCILRPQP